MLLYSTYTTMLNNSVIYILSQRSRAVKTKMLKFLVERLELNVRAGKAKIRKFLAEPLKVFKKFSKSERV